MIHKMTERTYRRMRDEYTGLCLACGAEKDSCEPDAEDYECDECGEERVYGIEQALIMGEVEIVTSLLLPERNKQKPVDD